MAKAKPGPKPNPDKTPVDAVTMVRSTKAWKEVIDELAMFDRSTTVSDMIDKAIVSYARSIGFTKSIPRRTG